MSTAVSARTRQDVLARDNHTCQRCGKYIGPFGDYSLQHRRARGMGGSKRLDTNLPANLITLCGSATSPDGCHHLIESNPDLARAEGMRLFQAQTPAAEPVLTIHGWRLLDNDGGWTEWAEAKA